MGISSSDPLPRPLLSGYWENGLLRPDWLQPWIGLNKAAPLNFSWADEVCEFARYNGAKLSSRDDHGHDMSQYSQPTLIGCVHSIFKSWQKSYKNRAKTTNDVERVKRRKTRIIEVCSCSDLSPMQLIPTDDY